MNSANNADRNQPNACILGSKAFLTVADSFLVQILVVFFLQNSLCRDTSLLRY